MKKVLKYIFLLLIIVSLGFFGWLWLVPNQEIEVGQIIPNDAVYILESEDAIGSWKDLSKSGAWAFLRKNDLFSDINEYASFLDSLIDSNKGIMNLTGRRKLTISAHMISETDYDFIMYLDLKKGAKLTYFKDLLFKMDGKSDYKFSKKTFDGHEVIQITDSENDSYHLMFKGNIMVVSTTSELLVKSIKQEASESFSSSEKFHTLKKKVGKSGPYQLYFNSEQISSFSKAFTDAAPEGMREIMEIWQFTGQDFEISDEVIALSGYTDLNDSTHSLLKAMDGIGKGRLLGSKILPETTSLFTTLDFADFKEFIQQVEVDLRRDPDLWDEYETNKNKLEKFLKIDFDEHLYKWIGNEIGFGMIPLDSTNRQQAYIALFHSKDIIMAKEKLDYVLKRIKRKTPVKFKTETYKDKNIYYMEMKGFFKIFFGKLFNKFEKPFFTYIGDFVVFSSSQEGIKEMIDNYEKGTFLAENKEFKEFKTNFRSQQNVFAIAQLPYLYNWLKENVSGEERKELENSKDLFENFPFAGLQLTQKGNLFATKAYLQFSDDDRSKK